MKSGKRYLPKDEIYPLIGLNTLDPSPQANPHTSPDTKNMVFTKGIVQKRTGYSYLGTTLTDPVIGVVEYESLTGTKTLLAFTTKKQYKFDTSTLDWVNITYQSGGVDVNWTGVESDTLDYAIVSGLDGSSVFKKWVVITNGKDQPRYWDGAAAKFALYAPAGITGFVTCKTITGYFNQVVMGNVKTASDNVTAVYWSNLQSLISFDSSVSDGGTGIAIMTDVDGPIQRLVPLADRCYIFTLNSIHAMQYVGGAIGMTFVKLMQESRLLSSRSVVNIGQYLLYMSQENIVLFDGTTLTREIGDRIYRGYRDELYASKRHFSFAFHDAAKRQVYFCYPTANDESHFYNVEYQVGDMSNSVWSRLKYKDRFISMGFFSRDQNLKWNSPQIAGVGWDQSLTSWAQGSIKGGFPVRVAGTSSGRVVLLDDTAQNDANTAVDAWWDSIDFTVPSGYQSEYGRWIEIELELRGFEAEIYYTKDQGQSYTFVKKLTLTNQWTKYKVNIDVMSKNLRIKVKNDCPSSWIQGRWLRLWVTPGGAA